MINQKSLLTGLSSYGFDGPFDHCIIDNFLKRRLLFSLKRNFQTSIQIFGISTIMQLKSKKSVIIGMFSLIPHIKHLVT